MVGLLGWPELILILVIVVFIFGAGRITELAKALGTGIREFKKSSGETQDIKNQKDEVVKEAAAKMGINIEGKTTSQLIEEINKLEK